MLPEAERFLVYLRDERGLSPRTVAAYRRDLERYSDELGRQEIRGVENASEHDGGQARTFLVITHFSIYPEGLEGYKGRA